MRGSRITSYNVCYTKLLREEINAGGGIAGQKVEMEFRDSTTKADVAIENCRYFVDSWGADFLAGIDSSGQALAIPAIIQRLDRVIV